MSLFICMDCGCIENNNCVARNIGANPDKPNMRLMDMHGYGDATYDVETLKALDYTPESSLQKYPVRMLCSECNTGVWHDEFEKMQATEDEIALSKISKYSMLTPFDQESHLYRRDDNLRCGYRLATPEELAAHAVAKRLFRPKLPEPKIKSERELSIDKLYLEAAALKRKIKTLKRNNGSKEELTQLLLKYTVIKTSVNINYGLFQGSVL